MKFFISSISICIRRKSSQWGDFIREFHPVLDEPVPQRGFEKDSGNDSARSRPISTTSDAIVVPASRNRVLIHGPGSFPGDPGVDAVQAYTAV